MGCISSFLYFGLKSILGGFAALSYNQRQKRLGNADRMIIEKSEA